MQEHGAAQAQGQPSPALGFLGSIVCTEIAYSLEALFRDRGQGISGFRACARRCFSVFKELPSCPALLIPHLFRVANGWLRP